MTTSGTSSGATPETTPAAEHSDTKSQQRALGAKRLFAARIAAVQAVYECLMSKRDIAEIIRTNIESGAVSVDHEDQDLDVPAIDRALYSAVAQGVFERFGDINDIINAHYNGDAKTVEPLLRSILLCASFELMSKPDLDAAILINDYLDVTHGFFDQNEVRLINGMLDRIAKNIR